MTRPAYPDWLGDELVAAARRREERRRRRRRRIPVAVTVVLAASVVSSVLLAAGGDRAVAGVRVAVRDGAVHVLLEDPAARPDDVERALRDEGIAVDLAAVPTGPSRVGRFLSTAAGIALPPDLTVTAGGREVFVGFAIPVDYAGTLRLAVGRAARPGEAYESFSDAFAAGEPLHCSGLVGARAPDAAVRLAGSPLRVRWAVFEPGRRDVAAHEAVTSYGDWRVGAAWALSATDVVVGLTPDGASPFPPSGGDAGDGADTRNPCGAG